MRDDHSLADHGHGHHYLPSNHERNEKRTLLVVVLTVLMMVGEIVVGWMTGSMALLADGFHMATHAGALGIAAAAYAYARTHSNDPRFTFGTGKVGELAAFASAIILGIVALGITWESAERLMHPTAVSFGDATKVAVLGLIVNLVSAWLLKDGGHDHHGHGHGHSHGAGHGHAHAHDHHDHDHAHDDDHSHHRHDNNMRSAYIHVLADALTSVMAILALLAGRYLGWVWLDPVVGIVGALIIAQWSWTLMRDTARILVDASETDRLGEVTRAIEQPGDVDVTDLHIWQVGPGAHAAIIALVASEPLDPDAYRARLTGFKWISHATIEVSHCVTPHCR
ncbi:MAG: cation transporter [Sphingomonas sanxanigenens]|uniref:Cation transporter n=1 Tax=Sphingomonas sanxanigenens TaxID=397260 RepID=A0A2W5C5W9_9SPHN|nr:MAG: cation transporter [Sphingomonas sanxanigenens]